jgi:PKHD-type hydroxylase
MFPITPYSGTTENLAWYSDIFTEQELDNLQYQAKNAHTPAMTGRGINNDVRRSQISWLNDTEENINIFKKLAHVASELNAKYFRFDLTGFGEPLQLTNYGEFNNGNYSWHQDYGSIISRKLSLVVQLTDPSEYEGGDLQTMTSGEVTNVRKQRGLVIAFPSFILHQVTPVTRGSRQSLVSWISGVPFR